MRVVLAILALIILALIVLVLVTLVMPSARAQDPIGGVPSEQCPGNLTDPI